MLAVLDHVSICKSIHQQLLRMTPNLVPKDPTLAWLCLYEFEAKLFLDHTDIEQVLGKVSALATVEAKTLESMAALCVRGPLSGIVRRLFYVCKTVTMDISS